MSVRMESVVKGLYPFAVACLAVTLALGVCGCGWSPPPEPEKTPEQIAKEREELNRRLQENVRKAFEQTAPKNPGQVPADAVPGDRQRHRDAAGDSN